MLVRWIGPDQFLLEPPRSLEPLQRLGRMRFNPENFCTTAFGLCQLDLASDIGGVSRGEIPGNCARPLGGRQCFGVLSDGHAQQ